ncbi:SulP family inorganic anion transporter [Cellulomonas chengniuliangii]|uniref:SulP family inorganic anion transporter n=1 Tax=Cellulomonas chengniuliangii TaxID=2968084 RepID=A0ABY5KU26_9CELL|nr:SulP family inorganic anion transporter [Cellulomonas chengniuliangii]MCC2308669.1 SulP family inorganic anion transporter [Cellulomonas chengniuliangii]MCC2317686.1 SulP family inorganic anion transporter [Cellulomonas chengniuliangii]UUI74027.1 SulP family inorganic anion transporter [Cellulomonas chengniuliangii]
MSAADLLRRVDWRATGALLARRVLPRRSDYAGLRGSWRADAIAGLTVAIVALPLALGFGVSSGLGATAGLVTAVVAGAVAAVFGGSHLQVSGPTGAMTVVLIPIVARYGPESVAVVSIMAGGLVIVGGLIGLGRLVAYIPWPVVEGFTLGIGVVIALQQVPLALDTPKADGENAALVAIRTLGQADWPAALPALGIVALVIAIMTLLPRVNRTLPASLVAVVVATLLVELAGLGVDRIGALPSSLPAPTVPMVSVETTSALFSAALAVAALAALESLLSARVADGMADDIPRTQPNRELVGQGLANVASGLFGGMPATGAIARTAVNVRAGARTRTSALLHAGVLAVIVYAAAPWVARIPLSALAGVLLVTAARMVDLPTARSICRSGRSGALVFLLTLGATIVFDLVMAVEIGIAVAAVLALRAVARTSGLHREAIPTPDTESVGAAAEHALLHEHIALYRIDGSLFFADVRRFLDELALVADVRVVVLRLSAIRVLDISGANALAEVVADLQRRGIVVLLKGLRPEHRRVVDSVGVLAELQHQAHLFTDLGEAIEHARSHVRRGEAGRPPASAGRAAPA